MSRIITASAIDEIRKRRYVACCGVFDILHVGHLVHLQWARRQGDALVVGVTPDEQVNKGPGRPHFRQHYRACQLQALTCIDWVVLLTGADAMELLSALKPDVFVKGPDIKVQPTEAFKREAAYVARYGGTVAFSPPHVVHHSTEILRTNPQALEEVG